MQTFINYATRATDCNFESCHCRTEIFSSTFVARKPLIVKIYYCLVLSTLLKTYWIILNASEKNVIEFFPNEYLIKYVWTPLFYCNAIRLNFFFLVPICYHTLLSKRWSGKFDVSSTKYDRNWRDKHIRLIRIIFKYYMVCDRDASAGECVRRKVASGSRARIPEFCQGHVATKKNNTVGCMLYQRFLKFCDTWTPINIINIRQKLRPQLLICPYALITSALIVNVYDWENNIASRCPEISAADFGLKITIVNYCFTWTWFAHVHYINTYVCHPCVCFRYVLVLCTRQVDVLRVRVDKYTQKIGHWPSGNIVTRVERTQRTTLAFMGGRSRWTCVEDGRRGFPVQYRAQYQVLRERVIVFTDLQFTADYTAGGQMFCTKT